PVDHRMRATPGQTVPELPPGEGGLAELVIAHDHEAFLGDTPRPPGTARDGVGAAVAEPGPAVVVHEEAEQLGGGVELLERRPQVGVVEAGLVGDQLVDDLRLEDRRLEAPAGNEPGPAAPGSVLQPAPE